MLRMIPVLILAFCVVATPAFAGKWKPDAEEGRPYLTLSGGISKVFSSNVYDSVAATNHDVTTKYGFNGMVATGLKYKAGRVELAGAYNYLKFDEQKIGGAPAIPLGGSMNAMSLLLNLFFDFNSDGALSPYIGAGAGGARVAIDSPGSLDAKNGTGFAYQVGGGINLNMGDSFSVDLGYRLLGVTNVSLGAYDADSVLFHNANMGLRFIF